MPIAVAWLRQGDAERGRERAGREEIIEPCNSRQGGSMSFSLSLSCLLACTLSHGANVWQGWVSSSCSTNQSLKHICLSMWHQDMKPSICSSHTHFHSVKCGCGRPGKLLYICSYQRNSEVLKDLVWPQALDGLWIKQSFCDLITYFIVNFKDPIVCFRSEERRVGKEV